MEKSEPGKTHHTQKIAFIGDSLYKDMLYANKNNMIGILTKDKFGDAGLVDKADRWMEECVMEYKLDNARMDTPAFGIKEL